MIPGRTTYTCGKWRVEVDHAADGSATQRVWYGDVEIEHDGHVEISVGRSRIDAGDDGRTRIVKPGQMFFRIGLTLFAQVDRFIEIEGEVA